MKAGYKQTEVGVIPEDWDISQLSEHFSIYAGGDVPKHSVSNFRSEKHPYPIFANALQKKGLYGFTGERRAKADSLTITARGFLGHAEYREEEFFPIVRLLVLEPNGGLDARFSTFAINERVKFAFESTGVPQLTAPQVGMYSIAAPPLREQRAIAEALSDVDGLLGGLDRLIAKKRDLKQAAMHQLLTGQTRLPGFHGEWEVKRLGDIAEMGSGGTPSSAIADYYDGDIPWVSIADMTKCGKIIMTTDRNLTRAGFSSCSAKMFPAGTVLYAMYASLGECSIAGISVCSSQAILGIRTRSGLSNEFLYYYLISLKSVVKSLGQQGTQANLNKGMVQDFCFSLPPLPEQTAIAEILSDMDAELTALEQRREKTRALKQAMMQELLTGRTRLV